MSKSNETSNLATLKHNDTLTDSELNAVSGGSSGAYDQWQLPGASHVSSDNPLIQAFLNGFYRNCGC
jgi:bacteriocin-like protein